MEIDITALAEEGDLFEFSASAAERGQNAGPETWANAKEEAKSSPLLTSEDQLNAWRDYTRGFGAWEDSEIDAWTPIECNALFIQFVSGDLRTAQELCPGDGPGDIDWEAYQKLSEDGTCSGNIYASDDQVFAHVGY